MFGSHVGNVLRRLRRIAAIHGTEPRFLLASATIANPVELAERLTGLDDFQLVDGDGAPRRSRRVAMWNPPLLDEALGVRGVRAVRGGRGVLRARRERRADDLLHEVAQGRRADPRATRSTASTAELAERIAPYRAGYTPAQRHEIERAPDGGELLGVVATDALELGIDIGELDAAICVTFPGTVASLRQMWGRAGRRGRGLAVYVAGEDALDQFFCRHPDEFLGAPGRGGDPRPRAASEIHAEHLLCAAHEAPLTEADEPFLGPRVARARASSSPSAGLLRERATGFVPQPRRRLPGGARRAALRLGRQLRRSSTLARAR